MEMTKIQTNEELDWELWNYTLDLEKEWRKSLPRFTDRELLQTFPEAKEIIPKKIAEWEIKRTEFSDIVRKKLTLIKYKITDEFSRWFWREWVKVNEGQELLKIDKHITRLKRLLRIAKGQTPKGQLTDEQIKEALTVPIESLINHSLRKCGKALIGLCPFHNEKHPSFYIYPETNSFWCYGCNQGGNVINFARLLYGYSFKEAVEFLIK